MAILTKKKADVFVTTDGEVFADREKAADAQIRSSLESMMHARRFGDTPGMAGHWTWSGVVGFIANNKEELRILLNGVMTDD